MRTIDADALLAEYDRVHVGEPGNARKLIENAPTIEERKTGKWIQDQKSKRYRCDQCLSFALKTDDMQENLSDFCPVCGATMEGEQP